jgi:hypothetical protein
MKLDYIFTDDTIFLSGGVKSSKILANGRDRDGFMGSDHAPMMCELHPRWRIKQSNFIRHYDAKNADKASERELECVATMFTKTGAKGPKSIEIDEALLFPGLSTPRPVEFPEELWKHVKPAERPLVAGRFKAFKSPEYLATCIGEVIKSLDIQDREEFYNPTWKTTGEEEKWRQKEVYRRKQLQMLTYTSSQILTR